MTTTQQAQISRDLAAILKQGADPKAFRQGLAGAYRVGIEEIDQVLAGLTATPRKADPEDVAQERLRQDRREAALYRDEARRWNHEEV